VLSDRLFRVLAEQTTDVISVLDVQTWSWVYVSPSVAHQIGHTPAEMMARPLDASLIDPPTTHDPVAFLRRRIERFEAGELSQRELVVDVVQRHRVGTDVRCEVAITLVPGPDGKVGEILCVSRDVTARRLAEAEVRASEVRLRTLVEQMDIGVMYQDALGRIRLANPAARRMLGLDSNPDGATGSGDRPDPQDLVDLQNLVATVHADGTPMSFEDRPGRVAMRTGQPVRNVLMGIDVPGRNTRTWVRATAVPHVLAVSSCDSRSRSNDDGDEVDIEVVTLATDVTDELAAAETLLFVGSAMESATAAIAITDLTGTIVYANRALVSLWGFSDIDDVRGRRAIDLWKSSDQVAAAVRAVSMTGRWAGTLPAERCDGTTFVADVTASPVHNAAGTAIGEMASVIDVSERVRLEGELRAAADQLARAQELAHIGSWEMDLDTRAMSWSAETYRIAGLDPLTVPATYSRFLELVHPDDRATTDAVLHDVVAKRQGFEIEHRLLLTDGPIVWVRHHGTLVEEGGQVRMIGTVQDITEHKRALEAERLEEERNTADAANRAKSAFLASMSHEIRTPMTAVLGFSQLLDEDPTLTDHQHEQLAQISRSGEHLLHLIDDILQMSTIESGHVSIQSESVDVDALLADLHSIFELRMSSEGLELRTHRADDVPATVVADRTRLRQILINLVGNAAKFTEIGSVDVQVTIADLPASDDGRSISMAVDVADTGPGIESAELERIFGRFEQTDLGRQSPGGAGLGLAISRGLTELMGGELSVTSTVGVGTRFRLVVPVQIAEEAGATSPLPTITSPVPAPAPAPTMEPIKVLVADDVPENRKVLAIMLETAGHQVVEASDGVEAVELFAAWKPDLVIMDLQMPHLGGTEAMRQIRSLPGGDAVRLVAATANVFDDDRREVIEAGGDGFLPKPFTKAQLLDVVSTVISTTAGNCVTRDDVPVDDVPVDDVPSDDG
jgi:PAS domain S-box-containing protein